MNITSSARASSESSSETSLPSVSGSRKPGAIVPSSSIADVFAIGLLRLLQQLQVPAQRGRVALYDPPSNHGVPHPKIAHLLRPTGQLDTRTYDNLLTQAARLDILDRDRLLQSLNCLRHWIARPGPGHRRFDFRQARTAVLRGQPYVERSAPVGIQRALPQLPNEQQDEHHPDDRKDRGPTREREGVLHRSLASRYPGIRRSLVAALRTQPRPGSRNPFRPPVRLDPVAALR